MSLDDGKKTFICYLLSLAREGKEDRGALADLRSGLGEGPGNMARVHRHVAPHLPDHSYDDRWYYVTATLFGLFPKHRRGYSMADAFRPLAFPQKEAKKDSMEARFVALLSARPDDLDDHLRHIVRLLESAKPPQPLDWFRFFEDLLQWDHPEGHVQLRWARDFYRRAGATGSKANTNHNQRTEQEEDHE
jgi:CRISPR system Cascade subunit CasB